MKRGNERREISQDEVAGRGCWGGGVGRGKESEGGGVNRWSFSSSSEAWGVGFESL